MDLQNMCLENIYTTIKMLPKQLKEDIIEYTLVSIKKDTKEELKDRYFDILPTLVSDMVLDIKSGIGHIEDYSHHDKYIVNIANKIACEVFDKIFNDDYLVGPHMV